MGGGAFVVPESISASETNPAGFGMSMEAVEAQINNYGIQDRHLNRSGKVSKESQGGLGIAVPPWGFGFSWFTPTAEIGEYETALSPGQNQMKVHLNEYHFTVSRVLIKDSLSVGVSANILKAQYEVGGDKTSMSRVLPRVGVLYNFTNRFFFGTSFRPAAHMIPDSYVGNNVLPGFTAPMNIPAVLSAGVGWIPNRYFRTGLNFIVPFGQEGSGLLADENVSVGAKTTIQPRLGASYVVMEYTNFKVELAAGAYYEVSRYSDQGNRFHKTVALDINPWFVNTSIGIDAAPMYRNKIVSIGLDIVRTARFFEIIPENTIPAYNGAAPSPITPSPEGLPAGMTETAPKSLKGPDLGDVGKIIEDIPKRIEDKIDGKDPQTESDKRDRAAKKKKVTPKSKKPPPPR